MRVSPVLPHSSPPLFIARCADAAGLPFQPGRYFSNGCGHTSAASNHFLEVSHFSSSNDDCRIVGITKVDATYRTKMACAFTSGGGMKMIRDITPISSTSFRFSDNEEGIAFSQTYRHCGGGETIDATNARHFWGVFVS